MSLPPIIEQMLSPDFYEHSVTEPIQLLQTHISFVLLTGAYAYKVKMKQINKSPMKKLDGLRPRLNIMPPITTKND